MRKDVEGLKSKKELQLVTFNAENNIVKKAEQLIASRYSLTAAEIKIISQLITMVKISDTSFQEYIFKVADWKDEQELKRKDIYKTFEDIADDLLSKPVTIRSQNGDWLKANWVSSARYIKGKGIIKFKISDELKPFLLALKNHFLQYDIKNILPMKSAYTIRLYELLKDWYMTEARYKKVKVVAKVVELAWLRQTFQIPKKYRYNDIKRQILQKAVADLPKYTDLKLSFEEIKESRRVVLIKFFIQKNKTEKEIILSEPSALAIADDRDSANRVEVKPAPMEPANDLFLMLPERYQTEAGAKLLNKYLKKGVKYITAQIEKTTMANPQSYLAYLHSALDYDFAGTEQATAEAEAEARAESKRIAKEQKEEEERTRTVEQDKKNLEIWYRLSQEEQEKHILQAAARSRWVRLNMERKEDGEYTHGVQIWGIKIMAEREEQKIKENWNQLPEEEKERYIQAAATKSK